MPDEWTPFWFKSLESEAFADANLWKVWSWCLLKTRRYARWVTVSTGRGVTRVQLKPGQFLFGRKTAAKELRMPQSSAWRRMLVLQEIGNVDIKTDRHYSVVTLCNYEGYRVDQSDGGQQSGQPTDNQRTTNGQPTDNQRTQKEQENKRTRELREETGLEPVAPALTIEALVVKWKAIPGVCPVRMVTPNRRKHFNTRAGEPGWLEGVEAALAQLVASTFCAGQNNRGWKADLDWFLRPNSVTNLIEGKYENGRSPNTARTSAGVTHDPDARGVGDI